MLLNNRKDNPMFSNFTYLELHFPLSRWNQTATSRVYPFFSLYLGFQMNEPGYCLYLIKYKTDYKWKHFIKIINTLAKDSFSFQPSAFNKTWHPPALRWVFCGELPGIVWKFSRKLTKCDPEYLEIFDSSFSRSTSTL